MTNEEIKLKIDKNNSLIQDTLAQGTFILNNTIVQCLKENQELQSQCTHSFKDGKCIYCYKEEIE